MGDELDFQFLEEKIFNYSEPISLNSNVSLGWGESLKFGDGIKIKKDNVVIDGNGHTIDAKGKVRVFDIYGNNVTLKNINFKNGFHEKYGGAVRNAGRCKLINCTFEDNHAKIDGNDVSNGSEMCVCDCEFSEKDSILNRGSLKTLKDQKPELDSFISGNEATPIIKVPKKDPPVDKDRGKKVPDVSDPDKEIPVRDLPVDGGETGEIIHIDEDNGTLVPGVGRLPFPAYNGDETYMFVSYAHIDSKRVFKEIKRFHDEGYHIWYDEGISPGNEWKEDIVKHLVDSSLFIVFITFNSVKSDNVKKEINYAIHKKIPILPIYLDDFDEIEMDSVLEFELTNIQGILKTNLSEEEYIYKYTKAFSENDIEKYPA